MHFTKPRRRAHDILYAFSAFLIVIWVPRASAQKEATAAHGRGVGPSTESTGHVSRQDEGHVSQISELHIHAVITRMQARSCLCLDKHVSGPEPLGVPFAVPSPRNSSVVYLLGAHKRVQLYRNMKKERGLVNACWSGMGSSF